MVLDLDRSTTPNRALMAATGMAVADLSKRLEGLSLGFR